jgi:hypothetical protein
MIFQKLIRMWDNYWFLPVSPSPICLYRIFHGILLLFSCAIPWGMHLLVWFGQHGLLSIEDAKIIHSHGYPTFSLLWLYPSDIMTKILFCFFVLTAICLLLGFHTRINAVISWFLLISFQNRNLECMTPGDNMLTIIGFLLIFSPAGKMFSLDSWLDKKRGIKNEKSILCEPWTQRLIQLLICTIYWQAFWGKLINKTWWDGTAIYYVMNTWDFGFPVPYLFDHLWTSRLLSWGTLAIEFSLWSLIWFREFRYWVLLFGVILHMSIEWSMCMPMSQYIMIFNYINFIDARDLERLINSVQKKYRQLFSLCSSCL